MTMITIAMTTAMMINYVDDNDNDDTDEYGGDDANDTDDNDDIDPDNDNNDDDGGYHGYDDDNDHDNENDNCVVFLFVSVMKHFRQCSCEINIAASAEESQFPLGRVLGLSHGEQHAFLRRETWLFCWTWAVLHVCRLCGGPN